MAHFYNCNDIRNPEFEPDIETPAKARRQHKVYPSVTTVLGIVKDAFLDSIYKPRMITSLAREHPILQWQDIERLTYGTRTHPITGDTIESSEFGTTVHKVIEQHIDYGFLHSDQQPKSSVWDEWALPFLEWFLADYKCRTNTKGKAKTYDKDCQQLAIEAFMLMKEHNLEYLPSCRSVVIDCDTKKHYHREWKQDEMQNGIKIAKKCAELYWLLRM